MRKFLLASVALVALAVPASAQQSLAIGGGLNFGNIQAATAAASQGTAAAGTLVTGTSTTPGAGFAAASPAGTIATGLGASVGQTNAVSGAVSIGNGAAITGGAI